MAHPRAADHNRRHNLAAAGVPIEEAAARLGITVNALRVWSFRNGQPFGGRAWRKLTAEDLQRLRDLHASGASAAEAARALRLTAQTVHERWRELGLARVKPRISPVLPFLTDAESRDVAMLRRRHRYRLAEALRAIRRPDLIPLAEGRRA